MDVQMPVMDGLEATRRIRALPDRPGLPIVALTAGNTDTEHRRAREAGLQDILAKPVDPEQLVQGVLRALVRQPVPGAQASAVAAAAAAADAQAWPQIEGIDTEEARRRLAGDVKLMRSMLQRVFELCEQCLAAPRDTPAQRLELAGLMHKLRGSAATLGAKGVAALAGELEQACHQDSTEDIKPLVARLGDETRQLQAASSAWLREPPASSSASYEPLDRTRLRELVSALQIANLDALGLFEALTPSLRTALDSAAFESLASHVENLEFEPALSLIRSLDLPELTLAEDAP
jgi:CheY-like chemotaxis protein